MGTEVTEEQYYHSPDYMQKKWKYSFIVYGPWNVPRLQIIGWGCPCAVTQVDAQTQETKFSCSDKKHHHCQYSTMCGSQQCNTSWNEEFVELYMIWISSSGWFLRLFIQLSITSDYHGDNQTFSHDKYIRFEKTYGENVSPNYSAIFQGAGKLSRMGRIGE